MAPAKKASPSKRSRAKPASPTPPLPPQSAVRRSTRVLKKPAWREETVPPAQLLGAAKLLHENIQKAIEQNEMRSVALDKTSKDVKHSESPQRPASNSAAGLRSLAEPVVHEQVVYQPSYVPIPPPEHTMPHLRANNLPPSRARSLRNLLASDILAGSDAMKSTTKRNHKDTHEDGDLYAQKSSKRHRGNNKYPDSAVRQLPGNPVEYALSHLHDHPRILSLTEISSMLQVIQDRIFGSLDGQHKGFSETYFSFNLTLAQCEAWPLHELRTKYIPLYMSARYLADGSQYGWRSFFTQSQTRRHLVSAILGEWFVQRIFKHTAFGFPQHLIDILEDKDREYLHYDAVVRSKERAKLLKAWYEDWKVWPSILDTTNAAANALADELLIVLHPLLPPTLFNPLEGAPMQFTNGRRAILLSATESQKQRLRSDIRRDLVNLILDCTALHKGIRLTGEDGTVVRFCPNLEKGVQFHPTAPVYCVNQLRCNQTMPADPKERSELCIKMTCFPRVEAVVPEGPDMQELAQKEAALRQELADEVAKNPPPSPSRMSISPVEEHPALNRGRHADITMNTNPKDNIDDDSDIDDDPFSWDDHSTIWPIVPPSLQDNEGRNPGILNPETNEINTVKRAAYVTIYPSLTPARVYCEWTAQPYKQHENLADAVATARATHPHRTRLRLEDLSVDLWNTWALYGGLAQWGVLAAAAVVGVCRALSIPSHIQSILMKLVTTLGRVVKKATPVTAIPLEHVPAHLVGQVGDVVSMGYDAIGPFGPALTGPFETLIIAPLSAVYKVLAGGGAVADMAASTTTAATLRREDVARVVDAVTGVLDGYSQSQSSSWLADDAVSASLADMAAASGSAGALGGSIDDSGAGDSTCGVPGLQGAECAAPSPAPGPATSETETIDGDEVVAESTDTAGNIGATEDASVDTPEQSGIVGSQQENSTGKRSGKVMGVLDAGNFPGWLRWQ